MEKDTPAPIPIYAACCANCLWGKPEAGQPHLICWADPPKLFQASRSNLLAGKQEVGWISIRPSVQAGQLCRHFNNRHPQPVLEAAYALDHPQPEKPAA